MAVKVLGFAGFRRRVRDLSKSITFYVEGLGFVDEGGGRLRLGGQTIELEPDASLAPNPDFLRYAAGRIDTGFQHIAVVASDMDRAYRRLMARTPCPISLAGPVILPAHAGGGVTAFKFLDPDGRPVELIQFPPGKEPPAWQRTGEVAPTLGIDHSAIAVSDAGRSIAYYRDVLDFELVSRQTNRGGTQVQLDGIDGVEVDVVALSPRRVRTPHLELLDYRLPKPQPGVSRDVLAWWVDGAGAAESIDPDGHRHVFLPASSGM